MSPQHADDVVARAKRVLSPVLGRYTWLDVERGEGSWLYTRDGRRILDLTSGIAVMNVGHSHPAVVRAVREQAEHLMHICAGVATYAANVDYAEALGDVAPDDLDTVFFCNSGAEAIEAAIKFARQVSGKPGIVGFRGGFHGRTTGAAALTSSKSHYKVGYAPLLPEVLIAPRRMHDKWQTGTHGSTFGGNPVSCAAGLATLNVIRKERLAERAETIGDIIDEELRPIAKQPGVGEIRRLGSMVGVEFVNEKGAPDKAAAKAAIAGALEREVLMITCGSYDQVVRFI